MFGITSKALKDIKDELTKERLSALAWLIETGALDVYLALRVDDNRKLKKGSSSHFVKENEV